jgi:murein DD-endopeptidase MepM/ murein hydrolase activator NlpD
MNRSSARRDFGTVRQASAGLKAVTLSLAVSCASALGGCGDTIPEESVGEVQQNLTGTVLFVAGSTSLNAADTALRNRLQSLGLTVTVKSASSAVTADATGKALVVVSSTVSPSSVGTKFRTVTVPVLTWESEIYDDMGMTPTASGNFGTQGSQKQGTVLTPSSPLAAGITGTQNLTSSNSTFNWGKPSSSARVVTLTSDTTKTLIFGYAAGAAMPGLTAPGRRVGFFLGDTSATSLTGYGWAFFDRAVAWSVGSTTGLRWPIDCIPGSTCTSIGYPDSDDNGQAFNCSAPGYVGHDGTDINITQQQMDAGVAVRAAADGVVWYVNDGKYDRCPNASQPDCQTPTNPQPGSEVGTTVCTELGPYCQNGQGSCYWCFAGGNVVIIKHTGQPGIFATRYDHLKKSSILVAPGQTVTRGQIIARVGSAGASTGPHLHFEVWRNTYYDVVEPWAGPCGPNFGPALWTSNPPWQ